jgi:integrase
MSGGTIRNTLGPLSLLCIWAEDEGLGRGNPVRELRRRERPRVLSKQHRQLTATELWTLVRAAGEETRPLVALLAFAGLRISEALGLLWGEVDLGARTLHIRKQLGYDTLERVPTKTDHGVRDIELDDGLYSVLCAWRLRLRHSAPSDFVVSRHDGRPLDQRRAARCLAQVVWDAGLDTPGLVRITPHQLPYTFGSLLIDVGESTTRVSRLLGHADEAITGRIYAHEIMRRDGGEKTRASMRAAFGDGTVLERTHEQAREHVALRQSRNSLSEVADGAHLNH